jgi:hypothetical protein
MANVTIPDLTAITTPGATTVIEVADPAATPVSRKMTLANAIINGLEDASLVAFTTASGALSVESSVANGGSAVAFNFDTENALSTNGAKVASFKNNGTEVGYLAKDGMLVLREGGYTAYGQSVAVSEILYPVQSFQQTDVAGHQPKQQIKLESAESENFNCDSIARLTTFAPNSNNQAQTTLQLFGSTSSGTAVVEAQAYSRTDVASQVYLKGLLDSSGFEFEPTITDGAAAIAYRFNTVNAMSNVGARIVTFEVGGAIKLAVAPASSAGQTSLLLYDADNNTVERVTVGAADSGGSGFKVLRIPN